MTDREKLVELLRQCVTQNITLNPDCWDAIIAVDYDSMADHLLSNGVIVLPCKVGDTVWFETYKRGEPIGLKPHKVGKIVVSVQIERGYGEPHTELPAWSFGKTVFLTREEAEAALRKEGQ
jgi:hypothetical protein